jgi:hypothetical protein
MTIRFSAARGGVTPGYARKLCASAPLGAVNDNPRNIDGNLADTAEPAEITMPILPDALRHFAQHGLSAALQARLKAEAASAEGDELACARWLAICRQFDRRMAFAAARRLRTVAPGD